MLKMKLKCLSCARYVSVRTAVSGQTILQVFPVRNGKTRILEL